MQIKLNGQTQKIDPQTTVAGLLSVYKDSKGIVVEHNSKILQQDKWSQVVLQEGDQLELVSLVGGG